MPHDRRLLYAATFLRALATGMIGVLAGIYLARLSFTPAAIGAILSAGLAGAALALALITVAGDRIGRRRSLVAIAMVSAAGGVAVAVASAEAVIAVAAFLGMLNANGRDRGAMLVLEQAIIPSTVDDAQRTRAFAWYNVLQDIGHAAGAAAAALPQLARIAFGVGEIESLRAGVFTYAVLIAFSALLYLRLSDRVELEKQPARIAVRSRDASHSDQDLRALRDRQHRRRIPRLRAFRLFLPRALRRVGGGHRGALHRRTRHERALPPRRRVARDAHRPREHDGLHAHPVEPSLADHSARAEASKSLPRSSCCARAWSRWTCRRGSPT